MPDLHPDPGAASGEGLRWNDNHDLLDVDHNIVGYVVAFPSGSVWGFVVPTSPGGRTRKGECPDFAAARAWVEDRVRSRAGGA